LVKRSLSKNAMFAAPLSFVQGFATASYPESHVEGLSNKERRRVLWRRGIRKGEFAGPSVVQFHTH